MQRGAGNVRKGGRTLTWFVAAVCASCDGRTQSSLEGEAPAAEVAASNEPVPDTPKPSEPPPTITQDGDSVELLIPLVPIDDGELILFLSEDEASGALTSDGPLMVKLALGEGYPNVLKYQVSGFLTTAASPSQQVVIESATPASDGVEVDILDDDVLELRVMRAGTHSVEVELSAEVGDTTHRFMEDISVQARQIAGAEWNACLQPPHLVSGSPLNSSRLDALDENGAFFEAKNTLPNRGADVIVRARAGTLLEAPAGIASLLATGPSQTIEIRSNYGEVSALQLIQPEEIDSIEPRFHFDQGGLKGGGATVESGGEIALNLSEAPYIFVHAGARSGAHHLCGGPDPSLFELRSTTPEVCTIQDDGCAVRRCPTNQHAAAIANVVAQGTCNLELEAPELNGGSGLSASYTVYVDAL